MDWFFLRSSRLHKNVTKKSALKQKSISNEPGAETHHNANATIIAMGLCWLVIIGINLAALWWTPPSQTTYLAAGVSILSAIIVWFLPGANPLWNRRRITSRKQQPNGKRRQAPNDQAPSNGGI
ncbi:hypothetical protein [Corynebacterium belfantii]|uniref:hypothetical protein n=1 Tax=Corynebacterium belfantii TaxID=2014537 RepID=UPI001F1B03ED|nr:hypothetical protein [Corynebacterium belfantii]